MSTLTRAAVYTVRIAAGTAAAPVLAAAAAASATAKLVGWELQLVGSPLSAEYRELAAANGGGANTPARRRGTLGTATGTAPPREPARAPVRPVPSRLR